MKNITGAVDIPEITIVPDMGDPYVVPDAVAMVAQAHHIQVQADRHFTLYGKRKDNPSGRGGYHPIIAEMWRAGDGTDPDTGVYGISAAVNIVAQLDPQSLRTTFTQLKSDPRRPLFVPDGVDGDPCISSARSLHEDRPVARNTPAVPE